MSDGALLQRVFEAVPQLPEPLAALAAEAEILHESGDATGVRKQLFELGIAVVRYATSVGFAALAEAGLCPAPAPLGGTLARAARLSDGHWCGIARELRQCLNGRHEVAELLGFAAQKPIANLVTARNRFAHEGSRGDEAAECLLAVLASAEALLARGVVVVENTSEQVSERRTGLPLRSGVWRKTRGELPADLADGAVYFTGGERWLRLDPWLPLVSKRLLLADSPHAPGKRWRSLDPESREHRECADFDEAMRRLAGGDASAPRPMSARPALVGREAVATKLRQAAEDAVGGSVRALVLSGPFGSGRSRMLDEIAVAAAGFGFGSALRAACSSERRGPLRALRAALGEAGEVAAARAAVDEALRGSAVTNADSAQAALEGVTEALLEASVASPLLLVLDDAQWADDQTLSVARMLIEGALFGARGRLLLVLGLRDEPNPSPAVRRLVAQVEGHLGSEVARLVTAPLPQEQARKLAQGVAPLAPELERGVVKGAGGIPFLIVHPLLAWSESGALEWRDGAWTASAETVSAPPSVVELVRARLTSFFDPDSPRAKAAEHALALVALAAAATPLALLTSAGSALGDSLDDLEGALETLVDARLLGISGPSADYAFEQAFMREASRTFLSRRPWFPRAHRALLDTLAKGREADADAGFLGEGYLVLGEASAARHWLERALQRALAIGAFDDAVAFAARARSLAETPEQRLSGDLVAIDARWRAGNVADAADAHASLDLLGVKDQSLLVRHRLLGLLTGFAASRCSAEHDPALEADADALGDARLAAEARLARALAVRGRRGLELCETAKTLLESNYQVGLDDLLYRAHALRIELLYELRTPADQVRTAIEGAKAVASRLGSAWALLDVEADFAVAVAETEPERAAELLRDVERRAAAARFGTIRRNALVNVAACLMRGGKTKDAAEAASGAAQVAEAAGSLRHLATARSLEADARLALGQLEEARAAIDQALATKEKAGDSRLALTLMRRVAIRERSGDLDGARTDARLALERAEKEGNAADAGRARLWLAIDAARGGGETEKQALTDLVEQWGPGSQPAPVRALLAEARQLLGQG